MVKTALGLNAADKIVGFLYLGSSSGGQASLARPALENFVSVLGG